MTTLTNRLLDCLPTDELAEIVATSDLVSLPVRTVLYEPGTRPKYAYFLMDGIASVVTNTERGDIAEVGIIGREGFTGAIHLLGTLPVPTQCFMQIAGSGRRLRMTDLQNFFDDSRSLHACVLQFVQSIAINARQLAACNALHTIEQRLARWLLVVQDRMSSDGYALTHEFLAEMLVVQRPTLSIVAGAFQREGMIHYRHGQLKVLKRQELEAVACECYSVARDTLVGMYATPDGAAAVSTDELR